MTDIATVWSIQAAGGDWVLTPAGLQAGSDLETAVLISLFTDATAAPDDIIPDGSGDPRGWWGDLGAQTPIGSKLWLLGRSKQLPSVLTLAQGYGESALQWLIDDGVAASVSVEASFPRTGMLGIAVTITEPSGEVSQFSWVWQGTQ